MDAARWRWGLVVGALALVVAGQGAGAEAPSHASGPPAHGAGAEHEAAEPAGTGTEHGESAHEAPKAPVATHAVEPAHASGPDAEAGGHGAGHEAEHPEAASGKAPSEGEGATAHAEAEGHGKAAHAEKTHAPDPAKELLRKRREQADSGYLGGELPRAAVVWKPRKPKVLHLESDVVVGPGQSLEIAAGTEIRVAARDRAPLGAKDWADSQFVSLIVRGGSLKLLGTAEKPIRFVPERGGKGVRWGGVEILDVGARAQVELAWVQIPGALRGVSFERASGVVRHAVIEGGNVGLAVRGGSAPEVVHSVLARNAVAGLQSEKSGPRVRGCLFFANTGAGAKFDGVGLARLENNGFWANAGGDVVRGPARAGGWKSDSVVAPDAFGNVRTDPVLLSSVLHASLVARKRDSLRTAPVWRRRLPEPPFGSGPWALSPFSPLLDRGSVSPLCRDRDGSACDIGLWGGMD